MATLIFDTITNDIAIVTPHCHAVIHDLSQVVFPVDRLWITYSPFTSEPHTQSKLKSLLIQIRGANQDKKVEYTFLPSSILSVMAYTLPKTLDLITGISIASTENSIEIIPVLHGHAFSRSKWNCFNLAISLDDMITVFKFLVTEHVDNFRVACAQTLLRCIP